MTSMLLDVAIVSAIITTLSSILTTVLTNCVTKKVSRHALVIEYIRCRAAAFGEVMEADVSVHQESFSPDSLANLTSKIHKASLYASEETTIKLLRFSGSVSEYLNTRNPQVYRDGRMDAFKAMRHDLMNYETPDVRDFRSDKRWFPR